MNSQEVATCSFCRADKPVLRQYLHAKHKPAVGDDFTFIKYCADCDLLEEVKTPVSEEENKAFNDEVPEKLRDK